MGIPKDDEEELHKAVKRGRTIAKKLFGWKIADTINNPEGKEEWKADFWLPAQLYKALSKEQRKKYSVTKEWKKFNRTYNIQDAFRAVFAYAFLKPIAKKEKVWDWYWKTEMKLQPVVMGM